MSDSTTRLDGRVAVISGGSRGIGLATARRFLELGASVLITGRKQPDLESARDDLATFGAERVAIASAHSAREAEVSAAFDHALGVFGHIDIVVNNAATNPSMAPLVEIDLAVFDKIIETNLRGYLIAAREGVRRMRASGGGAIINVSTVGAYRVMRGLGAYGVSKAAVNMLTQTLAVELADAGIRVNGVAPGLVRTRFSEALWTDAAMEKRMLRGIPLARIAEPHDIAGAIAFLASEAAAYVTGQTLIVDGGMVAG